MKPSGTCASTLTIIVASALCLVSCSDHKSGKPVSNSNGPLLIEPNVAMGQIHAGMRVEDVIAKLGEPERRTANALEYTQLGFAVMPGPDGVIQVVMCGDVTGINGPLVRAFTGRTKEGIGLTSTRQEVVQAYGQPSADEKMRGGAESMRYDDLGITFTLEGGKVYHMIVRLGQPEQPARTVTLEPLPNTTQR